VARMDDIKVIWDMIKADLYHEIGNTIADIFLSDLEVTEFDGVLITLSKNSIPSPHILKTHIILPYNKGFVHKNH